MSAITRSVTVGAVALLIAISVLLLPAAAEYPMFHLNPERTGNVSGDAPVTGDLLWKADVGCFINGGASIADGRVYVANRIGGSGTLGLYCLNETTGETIWHNPLGGSGGVSTPAILGDRLFVGSLTGELYCINATDRTTVWSRMIEPNKLYWGVGSCPLIYEDTVFVNTASDGALFAFDLEGNELWNITTGSYAGGAAAYYRSPAAHDGKIFFGGSGSAFYCVDTATRTEVWNFSTTGSVSTAPAIEDGVVYFATMSRMYAVDMDGKEVWMHDLKGTISSPAVAYGRVYIGSDDKKMYCFNASDGDEIWNISVDANVKSSPVVADETVYFGTNIYGDMVYALNASDGSLRWTYDTGNCIMAQPAVSDRILFIGSDSGCLYAFRDPPPLEGDLNHDWTVTTADALIALRMAVGVVPATDAADVSGDGMVTSLDALMILQAVA
jgi:cobaltochelatase CobN